MSKNYVGDVGTLLRVSVGTDISDATTVRLYITKPDATTATWVGAVSDCGKEITYTILSGDWDQDGEYLLQSYVVTPGGTWYGDTVAFKILARFKL